jgi:hypothetical protein
MSTKNREDLSVSLGDLHLKGALQPVLDAPYLLDGSINPALEAVQCLLTDRAPPMGSRIPFECRRTLT